MRVFILICAGLSGCGFFADKPYLIEELTVLTVIAEPPSVGIGEAAQLRAVIVNPLEPTEVPELSWSFCRSHDLSQSDRGCRQPERPLALGTARVGSALFEGSALQVVQAEHVAGVPLEILEAGFWQVINLRGESKGAQDKAFKRLTVTTERSRNTNPTLYGVAIAGEVRTRVDRRSGPFKVRPDYDPATLQAYRVPDAGGQWQDRAEEADFSWFVTSGELDTWQTRYDEQVVWSPDDGVQGWLFCVMRDGRGGTAVTSVRAQ